MASLAKSDGPWVVIDGYHAFMALPTPFGEAAAQSAFYLGGGYKYAMSGEGCAFLHAPPGFGPRPPVTGWFAEFEDLTLPPGSVGYSSDAMRFMGATFDPSALYRFNAVQRMLAGIADTPLGEAELLNPLDGRPHARFLAFRGAHAMRWYDELKAQNCITDVRGDVLRIGLGLYHDDQDIDAFAALARKLSS